MDYYQTVRLKDGRECILRSATAEDAAQALENFILTHGQTDFLTSYPDEIIYTVEKEAELLQRKAESEKDVEILAELDGKVVGLAGIDRIGRAEKTSLRANFGISIDKDYWGCGIGRALTRACIACAEKAGYAQLELEVVAENERAVALYKSEGFTEYGRNPLGFFSRTVGWQALILMRLELNKKKGR